MLFDSPADPASLPLRHDVVREHANGIEPLAFFRGVIFGKDLSVLGSDWGRMAVRCSLVSAGKPIRYIWMDRRFEFHETLEERLICGGGVCIAFTGRRVDEPRLPPVQGWRRFSTAI